MTDTAPTEAPEADLAEGLARAAVALDAHPDPASVTLGELGLTAGELAQLADLAAFCAFARDQLYPVVIQAVPLIQGLSSGGGIMSMLGGLGGALGATQTT